MYDLPFQLDISEEEVNRLNLPNKQIRHKWLNIKNNNLSVLNNYFDINYNNKQTLIQLYLGQNNPWII